MEFAANGRRPPGQHPNWRSSGGQTPRAARINSVLPWTLTERISVVFASSAAVPPGIRSRLCGDRVEDPCGFDRDGQPPRDGLDNGCGGEPVTPTEYQTVFELGLRSFPWSVFIVPSGLMALGFALFRFFKQEIARAVGGVMFAFGACLLVILCVEVPSRFNELRRAYMTGETLVTEGQVENFQPVPFLGPSTESFFVSGVHFSYNVGDATPCFHDAFPYKVPIHAGQYVRVHYINGCIQRLEIRTESVPSAAERSEYAKTEAAERKRFLETDARVFRGNLAVTFFALIVSLCWNLDWRHYIRYWVKREPPYSRTLTVGFRCFFFVTFIGAAVQMFRLTTERFRTSVDFEKAGLLSLFGIGFFILVDLFFRWRFRARRGTFGGSPQPTSEK